MKELIFNSFLEPLKELLNLSKFQIEAGGIMSAILTTITHLLGTPSDLILALLIAILLDISSGWTAAWYTKRLNSKCGSKGAAKKLSLLFLVIFAGILDKVLGLDVIQLGTIYFFIANEGLSICENLGYMGLPIPKFLVGRLKQIIEPEEQIEINRDTEEQV